MTITETLQTPLPEVEDNSFALINNWKSLVGVKYDVNSFEVELHGLNIAKLPTETVLW